MGSIRVLAVVQDVNHTAGHHKGRSIVHAERLGTVLVDAQLAAGRVIGVRENRVSGHRVSAQRQNRI